MTMNDNEIRNAVLVTLTSIAPEIDARDLDPDKPLRNQVDLDSMDYLNFLIGLHRHLGVDIPEVDYGKLGTLNSIVSYLAAKRA